MHSDTDFSQTKYLDGWDAFAFASSSATMPSRIRISPMICTIGLEPAGSVQLALVERNRVNDRTISRDRWSRIANFIRLVWRRDRVPVCAGTYRLQDGGASQTSRSRKVNKSFQTEDISTSRTNITVPRRTLSERYVATETDHPVEGQRSGRCTTPDRLKVTQHVLITAFRWNLSLVHDASG